MSRVWMFAWVLVVVGCAPNVRTVPDTHPARATAPAAPSATVGGMLASDEPAPAPAPTGHAHHHHGAMGHD